MQPKPFLRVPNVVTTKDNEVIKSGFYVTNSLNPDPFYKSDGSVMGFQISIFRDFENSEKIAVLTKTKK